MFLSDWQKIVVADYFGARLDQLFFHMLCKEKKPPMEVYEYINRFLADLSSENMRARYQRDLPTFLTLTQNNLFPNIVEKIKTELFHLYRLDATPEVTLYLFKNIIDKTARWSHPEKKFPDITAEQLLSEISDDFFDSSIKYEMSVLLSRSQRTTRHAEQEAPSKVTLGA